MHTLTPSLNVEGAAEAIEFYKRAFGAEERFRALDPTGKKVWHAELRIGDSILFVNDTAPEMGATPSFSTLWIYTENVDAAFDRAVKAGARVTMQRRSRRRSAPSSRGDSGKGRRCRWLGYSR